MVDSLALLGLSSGPSLAPKEVITERLHTKDNETIAASIEATTRAVIHAINSGNFISTLPPWTFVSEDFTISNSSGIRAGVSSKASFIEKYRQLFTECPDFHVDLAIMHTNVYRKAGFAEVLHDAEESWYPRPTERMARKSVTLLEFRLTEGVWMLSRETSVNGLDAEKRSCAMGC